MPGVAEPRDGNMNGCLLEKRTAKRLDSHGFGSIGPFNRAFKAQTGRTPTEFRRDRCELGQAHTAT
jgi:hypothetical protein